MQSDESQDEVQNIPINKSSQIMIIQTTKKQNLRDLKKAKHPNNTKSIKQYQSRMRSVRSNIQSKSFKNAHSSKAQNQTATVNQK